MAINPELITTIRVDQLPDETLSLTNLFPHTVGTDLKSATIQELVDLVATSIGVSGGVGYLAISVTDGQQLPNVPELPGFFLCGAGTYLNINGYPDVICTDELNAVMSLTDHWQLAVGIPIVAEVGVQSVTGSAVDNTDPLNPVINEIIFGVQNIIAGTNIDVDDTDPANPIISVIGGGGTQDLQQVTDEGNETTNDVIVKDTENKLFLTPRSIQFQDIDQEGSTTLRFEDTDVVDQEVFIRGLGGTMALTSDITTPRLSEVLTESNETDGNNIAISNGDAIILDNGANLKKGTTDAGLGGSKGIALRCAVDYELKWEAGRLYVMGGDGFTIREVSHNFTTLPTEYDDNSKGFVEGSRWILDNGDVYLCGDATTNFAVWELYNPISLQSVLDNNHDLINGNNFQGTAAGLGATGFNINAFGTNAALNNSGSSLNALGNTSGNNNSADNVNAFGDSAGDGNSFNHVNLFGENAAADEDGQTVLSKDGAIMARISTTDLTATRKYTLQDGDGTLAFLSDITGGGGVPYTGATQDVDLGEFGLKAGQLTLDTTPTGTAVVTATRWNDSLGSSETTLKGGNVILKNGVDLVARIVNKVTPNTTLTKAAYQVVRISGAQGQRLAVDLARANSDLNSADTLGVVTETITTNQEGFILTVGQLEGINTTGSLQGETWADGDVLYLSPTTAGRMTNIKPNGSNGHIVVIGYVEHAHNTQGKIYVKIMNGWELDELHNVFIDTPLNNQGLVYETSTDLWKNKTIIENSITDGVTTIAPSQNAVFDALALKQAVLSYTPYKNIQTSQTAHTGTTAETNIFTATIPAGAFNSTDIIKVLFGINKTTALAGYILRLRLSTTNNPLGGTLIAYFSGGTGTASAIMTRNFSLNGGNLYGVSFPTTIITDQVATNVLSSTALNPSNQFFIHANITLANAGDSIIGTMLSIHN